MERVPDQSELQNEFKISKLTYTVTLCLGGGGVGVGETETETETESEMGKRHIKSCHGA